MEKNIDYDGIFKELLGIFPDDAIIEMISGLFEREYPLGSKVMRLATETMVDGEKRHSDLILRIGKDMFHIEVQSSPDNMALRVFEYSYRAAMQHGRTSDGNSLRLKFPQSVVIYLRRNEKTSSEINVELELPDGKEVLFKVPARHLDEYSVQDLARNDSMILAPFYPMLYEGKLQKSAKEIENLKNNTLLLIDKIYEKVETGKVSKKTAGIIKNALEDILENVMVKSKITTKEVGEVMEAVRKKYNIPLLNTLEEVELRGEARGEERGKAEGLFKAKVDDAIKMFKKGFGFNDIQDITGLKTDYLEKLQQSLKSEEQNVGTTLDDDDDLNYGRGRR